MKPRNAVVTGLLLGGFTSLSYLVMPITVFLTAVVWVWVLVRQPRRPALAGGLTGFGLIWLVLLARVTWACLSDLSCVQPSFVWVWFAPGVVALVVGLTLLLADRSRSVGE